MKKCASARLRFLDALAEDGGVAGDAGGAFPRLSLQLPLVFPFLHPRRDSPLGTSRRGFKLNLTHSRLRVPRPNELLTADYNNYR